MVNWYHWAGVFFLLRLSFLPLQSLIFVFLGMLCFYRRLDKQLHDRRSIITILIQFICDNWITVVYDMKLTEEAKKDLYYIYQSHIVQLRNTGTPAKGNIESVNGALDTLAHPDGTPASGSNHACK